MDLPSRLIAFPLGGDIVYVIGFEKESQFVPIYVGESTRNIGRFGDYVSAKFSAQTDFKVGIAIKALREKGFQVSIKYHETTERKNEERKLITQAKAQGFQLLNDLKGYSYKVADVAQERERVVQFIHGLLNSTNSPSIGTEPEVRLDIGKHDKPKVEERIPIANAQSEDPENWPELARAINNAGKELCRQYGNRIPSKAIIKRVCESGKFEEASVMPYDYCYNHRNQDPNSGRRP